MTRIVISDDNQSYFVGTSVGSVHILNALDLSLQGHFLNGPGEYESLSLN